MILFLKGLTIHEDGYAQNKMEKYLFHVADDIT
jgi:hypothetical protein